MKVHYIIISIFLMLLLSSCEQYEEIRIRKTATDYFKTRSLDAVYHTDNYKKYLADTFYSPGSDNEIDTYLITNEIKIKSIEKTSTVINSVSGLIGNVFQVEIIVQSQNQLIDTKLITLPKKDHRIILSFVLEKNCFRINTDTSYNTEYIFMNDYSINK